MDWTKVSRLSPRSIFVSAILLLASMGASIGLAAGWRGSSSAVPISGTTSLLTRSELYVASPDTDLAAFDEGLVAAWAITQTSPGIAFSTMAEGAWGIPTLVGQAKRAWAPSITYESQAVTGVWVRGDDHDDPEVLRSVIGYDPQVGTQEIAGDLYGQTSPDLASSTHGDYLVYTAIEWDEPSTLNATATDLYFAFRSSGHDVWPDPGVLITSTTAVPEALSGGISSPRIAVVRNTVQSAEIVHVVWQQNEKRQPPGGVGLPPVYTSIWHISGRWTGLDFEWDEPEQISPADQRYAVVPALATTDDGGVHTTWTELDGDGLKDSTSDQYIHYRLVGSSAVVNVTGMPFLVNSSFPSWAISTLATWGDTVCVSWHGHTNYELAGAAHEVISLRCSKNGGVTWLRTVTASEMPDQSSLFPKMTVDQNDKVHLIWTEYLSSIPTSILYKSGSPPLLEVFLPLVLKSQ